REPLEEERRASLLGQRLGRELDVVAAEHDAPLRRRAIVARSVRRNVLGDEMRAYGRVVAWPALQLLARGGLELDPLSVVLEHPAAVALLRRDGDPSDGAARFAHLLDRHRVRELLREGNQVA